MSDEKKVVPGRQGIVPPEDEDVVLAADYDASPDQPAQTPAASGNPGAPSADFDDEVRAQAERL